MVLPTPLRYWLVRLKGLNRPWLACSVLAIALGGVALREYWQHPEWVGQFETDSDSPGQLSEQTTQLTPGEQGMMADIDNSAALLAQFGIDPQAIEVLPEPENENADSLLAVLEDLETPDTALQLQQPATLENPFEPYLQQYRFGGAQSGPSAENAPSDPSPSGVGSELSNLAPIEAAGATQSRSPLEQALQRQFASTPSTSSPETEPEALGARSPALPGQSSLQQSTLPNSNIRFNLSNPQMSPPPGTTGYVAPVTSPAPLTPTSPGTTAPPLPGATPTAMPDLRVPNQSSNPYDLAPAPSGTGVPGSTYQRPSVQVPEPEPFSVPRPPGSYTGGGYINTFSDPGGYVD